MDNSNAPAYRVKEDRYEPTDQALKRRMQWLFLQNERKGDFLEWLFEHSEHCDHISQSEAWEEFEAWEEKQYDSELSKTKEG